MPELKMDVLGSTGLRQSGGRIEEEWHPRLKGSLAAKIYREMSDNDPVVGAFIYMIESLVRQVEWTINTSGDTPEHAQAAEFLEGAMGDMSQTWADFVSEALTMIPNGWSYFEVVYKTRNGPGKDPKHRSRYDDGAIGWRKMQLIGQTTLDRWELDPDGGIRGLHQADPMSYQTVFIPIEKAVLFRTKTNKNNPEGRSMLRNAYRSWYFLKRIQEIEAIGIERDLAGYPILEVPPELLAANPSPTDRALRTDLEQLVQQIRRDEREGALMPAEKMNGKETGFKFRLAASGGRRPIDVNAIVQRYESRIAMSVLAEFLLIGTDKTGSYSLVSSKTDLFAIALGAMLDSLASTFNRFLVSKLMALNGVKQELWPELVHGDIEKPDIMEFANYLKTLSDVGMDVADEDTERLARDYGGLPMPEAAAPSQGSVSDDETEAAAAEEMEQSNVRNIGGTK